MPAYAIAQSPFRFLGTSFDSPLLSASRSVELQAEFKERFFAPWGRDFPSVTPSHALWAWKEWKDKAPWGDNLRPYRKEWMDALLANCAMDDWGSVNRKAVACVDTDLRALPTGHPFFRDPSLAGEGFPFDYLQNSRVKAGEPLFAGHFSKDSAWVFVETGYASGWVDARNIAIVDDDLAKRWMGLPFAFVVDDNVVVRDLQGLYRFTAKIGTVLPLLSAQLESTPLTVGIPVRDQEGKALFKHAVLPAGKASPGPVTFNQWNIASIMDRMIGTPYGWGDSFGNRDCSGAVRDLFTPFGIWLPRNSAAQARAFPFVAFEQESGEEKEKRLASEAVPFSTLLRIPGHIMVYVGTYRGDPCVFHSFWGIRTLSDGAEGRHIIGETVITTLHPGEGVEDLDPSRGELADRLEGMTFIVPQR